MGEAQWLSQTTHPIILPALSILSSIKTTEGTLQAMKHLFRYLKGKQDYALVKEIGNKDGFMVVSDADWAGLFDLSGGQELRSRTGIQITYDGMPITCKSYFQKCASTNYKPGQDYTDEYIATSSADSELHAAKDALSEALHLWHVAEELEIPLAPKIRIFMIKSGSGGDPPPSEEPVASPGIAPGAQTPSAGNSVPSPLRCLYHR